MNEILVFNGYTVVLDPKGVYIECPTNDKGCYWQFKLPHLDGQLDRLNSDRARFTIEICELVTKFDRLIHYGDTDA